MTKAESFAMQYGYYDKEKKRACCVGYNAGYKQAEKDLALTWEDLELLHRLFAEEEDNFSKHDKYFYAEVLTRFKQFEILTRFKQYKEEQQ